MTVAHGRDGRQPNKLSPILRRWRVEIGAVVFVVVAVTALFVIQHQQNSDDQGPLEGDEGLAVTIPVRLGDKGVAWGNLELYNHSATTIVLDRVTLVPGQGNLALVREPYIWGKDRLSLANNRSLVAWQLPIPKEWSSIPEHPVMGYEIPPMPPDPGQDIEAGIGPEIVIELGPPTQVSSITSIRVEYHVGGRSYSRTFDNSLTICPPEYLEPCTHNGASPSPGN